MCDSDMARNLIAQCTFNPFMRKFLTRYLTWFPSCAPARDLLRVLEDLSGADADHCAILDMFLESMAPHEKALKQKDSKLFFKEECEFLRYLELSRIWQQKPELTAERKTEIWKGLTGAYLVVEILVRIPPPIMAQLEDVLRRNYSTISEDRPFDEKQFETTAQEILLSLQDRDIKRITKFFWEFCTCDFTPIMDLIPVEYHVQTGAVLDICRSPESKQFLLSKIGPVIEDIKDKVGPSGDLDRFEEGAESLFDDEDDEDDGEGDDEDDEDDYDDDEKDFKEGKDARESKEEKLSDAEALKVKTERARILTHVVKVFSGAISKNRDRIKDMMANPAANMGHLLASLTSSFVGFVSRSSSSSAPAPKTKEELKRERERDDVELFGSTLFASGPRRR